MSFSANNPDAVENARRISQLMKRLGFTQKILAERLNVTHVAVWKWVNGKAEPSAETFHALSVLAGDSEEGRYFARRHQEKTPGYSDLIERAAKKRPPSSVGDFKPVPLVAEAAGAGRGLLHEGGKIEGTLWLPVDLAPGETRCVRIKGDSMEPLIPDRSIAAVDCLQVNAKKLLGKVVAVEHPEQGVMVKRLREHAGKLLLASDNSIHAPIELDDTGWRIAGRVQWWIVKQR